ncbi:MAG: hypothetical protein M2R45_04577 [Verrucomicrobia subdivision 3 bacterium]|nr:hypothetical protein [Limisphaerales bacterium]MCS1417352.1 hypothetical protein [Limisphaerales bacterium]
MRLFGGKRAKFALLLLVAIADFTVVKWKSLWLFSVVFRRQAESSSCALGSESGVSGWSERRKNKRQTVAAKPHR